MARAREPVADRIHRNASVQANGCWLWTGSKTSDGYGVLAIGRKQHRAHRASFEAFVGPVPAGQLVCHACDTPLCVNPAHLFTGSPRDNTRDMLAKGRGPALPTGENHHNARISPAQREEIRRLRAAGQTLSAIAERFGVSFQTISAICNGVGSYGTR